MVRPSDVDPGCSGIEARTTGDLNTEAPSQIHSQLREVSRPDALLESYSASCLSCSGFMAITLRFTGIRNSFGTSIALVSLGLPKLPHSAWNAVESSKRKEAAKRGAISIEGSAQDRFEQICWLKARWTLRFPIVSIELSCSLALGRSSG